MEKERGGGAVDVKLMSLDSSDVAQQHWSRVYVCVHMRACVCAHTWTRVHPCVRACVCVADGH